MCVALPLDIRVQGTCSGQTCTFFVESRKDARPKKPRRRCSRPCLSKAPHDAAKSTGGVRGVAARRKCAGCAAHFGIRSPDGAALLLFVLFFTALPSRSFFLPRSFLFPPTRRYRQGLACSLASEGNSSVVLGPSRAFGRPARLSWNPGRIRALSFCSAPLFQSLCSQTALERNMLLDSRGEIRKLGARIWRINVIKRCSIGLTAGLVGD